VPFLGSVRLFDWDEINFAESAREMLVTGHYLHMQIDYRPFFEKPPAFIWLQVCSMKIFGVNEFAARLPNALIGAVTMLVIFSIGTGLKDRRFGVFWCIAYAGSLLPHFYFRSGIIDPLFNLFIFLGVWAMMKATWKGALWAGFWAGMAVMTKGPVGYGLVMITTGIAWIVLRKDTRFPMRTIVIATCVAIMIPMLWIGMDYLQNGPTFIRENIAYQIRLLTTGDAGHEQPWYYHSVVVLIGCYPASIFFFGGLRKNDEETQQQRAMRVWMIVLFFVVLVVFSIVKTKIIHYSSMTYLPLTYLAAVGIQRWVISGRSWTWLRTSLLFVLAVPITTAVVVIPWAFMQKEWLLSLPTFRDVYLRAALQQNITWIGIEPWVGIVLLLGLCAAWYLQRNGYRSASIFTLFGSVIVFVCLFLPLVAPRIEPYTQGAALNFYESLRGKDVYVKPLTMKSYAHLFYTNKPLHLTSVSKNIAADDWEPWLLNGSVDRPAYFVAKVSDATPWRNHPNLQLVREEGGFVIFQRRVISLVPVAPLRSH